MTYYLCNSMCTMIGQFCRPYFNIQLVEFKILMEVKFPPLFEPRVKMNIFSQSVLLQNLNFLWSDSWPVCCALMPSI